MSNWSPDLRNLSFLQDVVREVLFVYAKFDGPDNRRLRPTEEMIRKFCDEDPLLSEWLQPQVMGGPDDLKPPGNL
jgi:hypothetical protein